MFRYLLSLYMYTHVYTHISADGLPAPGIRSSGLQGTSLFSLGFASRAAMRRWFLAA